VGKNFILWLVDSSTKLKYPSLINESKEELHKLIHDFQLEKIPLLVLLTKGYQKIKIFLIPKIVDLPGGYSAYEVPAQGVTVKYFLGTRTIGIAKIGNEKVHCNIDKCKEGRNGNRSDETMVSLECRFKCSNK
jgi:hypothetical protein